MFWVSWGVLFKGLGVQKDTQTPCWLRPCIKFSHILAMGEFAWNISRRLPADVSLAYSSHQVDDRGICSQNLIKIAHKSKLPWPHGSGFAHNFLSISMFSGQFISEFQPRGIILYILAIIYIIMCEVAWHFCNNLVWNEHPTLPLLMHRTHSGTLP